MGRLFELSTAKEAIGVNIEEHYFVISADLGQVTDYTAISITERIVKGRGVLGYHKEGEKSYHVRHIERPPRGTEYPDIVDRLLELYKSPELQGQGVAVVLDLTGLGRPVFDLMKRTDIRPRDLFAISITGGENTTEREWRIFGVPKRDLVSNLQIMLQNGSVKVAKGLKEADALIDELMSFQTKISASGHDVYGARSGAHDDIVLSVAMGAWLASSKHLPLKRIGLME